MVQTLRCTLLNLRRRVTAATKIELRVNLPTVYSRNSLQYETDLSVSIRPAFEGVVAARMQLQRVTVKSEISYCKRYSNRSEVASIESAN